MCYDISFKVDIPELADYFPDLIFDEQIEMPFGGEHIMGPHLHPTHPIIYASQDDGSLHCRNMEWGVIPHYTKDIAKFLPGRTKWLNARSEGIFGEEDKYWKIIRNRRCLIPVTGFYEHREVKGWKNKVPYHIRPEGESIFFLPGLYAVVNDVDKETGEVIRRWTYTILTRSAIGNDAMLNIHNSGQNQGRMPLILPFDMSKEFVQRELPESRYREILDFQMPGEKLDYHPVFTIRGPKLRPDDKPKYEYWEWPNLPALGTGNPV